MNAAVAPLPRLRPLHASDLDALMQIENRAYEFPWTEAIFRDYEMRDWRSVCR